MNKHERQPVIYDLLNLPPQLFKYYGYDSTLNEKRLSGEVYLATPFDFNDPCDCQRDVINNSKEKVNKKGVNWLCRKLQELGYSDKETERLSISLQKDDTDKYEVYKRQLEKVGILCLTTNHADSLMWGYYTNNEGFCIEYDVTQIIHQLSTPSAWKVQFWFRRQFHPTVKLFPERFSFACQQPYRQPQ